MKKGIIKGMAFSLALLLGAAASAEVKATGDLWMRDEPNLNGAEITIVNTGKTLEYLGEASVDERGVTWYKVRFGGREGWVSSKYSKKA